VGAFRVESIPVIRFGVTAAGVLGLALLSGTGCGGESPGGPSPSTSTTTVAGTPSVRVLVVSHTEGFRHDSIAAIETGIRDLGTANALYFTDFCRTAADVRQMLTVQNLTAYRAVVFANTTGTLPIPDLAGFLSWIAGGGGFVGIHSASDTYHDQPSYLGMLGGEFVTHGRDDVEAEIRVDDATHPAVSHLAPTFRITDEFYRFRFTDDNRRVLMSLARDPGDGGPAPVGAGQPLAWHKTFSSGRVFYTALGHRSDLWQDARYRRHILEGIRWALQ
jgi:type 1 glutamine amidotransferase